MQGETGVEVVAVAALQGGDSAAQATVAVPGLGAEEPVVGQEREIELTGAAAEPSSAIRARVLAARGRQLARQGKPNAWLGPRETERHCTPDAAAVELLRQAIARLALSARAYHRVLRVARSIADLAASDALCAAHVAEAIQYRRLDAAL